MLKNFEITGDVGFEKLSHRTATSCFGNGLGCGQVQLRATIVQWTRLICSVNFFEHAEMRRESIMMA
jgi:hypothetical protein